MNKKKIIFILFFLLTTIYFFNFKKNKKNLKEVTITCTTSIIGDVLKNLLGEWAEIIILMGPGIDPHLYKAKSGDIYSIERSKIVFYNGLHLEGKMVEVLENLSNKGKSAYAISDCLSKNDLRKTEYDDIYDPHIWFDVDIWIKVTEYIAEKLIENIPNRANEIKEKKEIFLEKLNNLNIFIKNKINEIPFKKRILITAHDAFGYFGKKYGIQVEGLQGISTDAEVRIDDVERVARIILDNDIKTIFVEQTVPEKYLFGIKELVKGHGKEVLIGNKIYSDALGEEEFGNTYIKMFEYNVKTIAEGLSV